MRTDFWDDGGHRNSSHDSLLRISQAANSHHKNNDYFQSSSRTQVDVQNYYRLVRSCAFRASCQMSTTSGHAQEIILAPDQRAVLVEFLALSF